MQILIIDAIIDFSSLGDVDYQEPAVFADLGRKEPILVVPPLVDQDVRGLIGSKPVKIELLVVIDILELLAGGRRAVAAVIEALVVLGPRNARKLDPLELIRQVFAGLDV